MVATLKGSRLMNALTQFADRDWLDPTEMALARKRGAERKVSQYVIEKGIPIPPQRGGGGRCHGITAVLRKLRRGESVLLPIDMARANRYAWSYIGPGAYAVRKILGGGVRVWRTG